MRVLKAGKRFTSPEETNLVGQCENCGGIFGFTLAEATRVSGGPPYVTCPTRVKGAKGATCGAAVNGYHEHSDQGMNLKEVAADWRAAGS